MWETRRVFHISTGTLSVLTAPKKSEVFHCCTSMPTPLHISLSQAGCQTYSCQVLLSESSVKPFNQAVLCGLPRLDEFPLYVVLLTPSTHGLSDKLRPIVRTDLFGFATPLQQFFQFPNHPLSRQACVNSNGKCLPTEIVDDVQCTDRLSTGQSVVHEIKTPGDI